MARRDSEIVRLDPSGVQELPLRPPASPTRIPRPPSNLLGWIRYGRNLASLLE